MKKITIIIIIILLAITSSFSIYKLNEFSSKKEQERLEKERISVALIYLKDANSTKTKEDINKAKKYIEQIKSKSKKEELKEEIQLLELEIKQQEIRTNYNEKLNTIEKNLNQTELNAVVAEINLLEYENLKKELLERTNVIQNKINIEVKRKEEQKKQEEINYYNKMKQIDATPVISTPPSNITVLETITGKITAFTPYCVDGCHGYVASGKFVGNGDIYQYDHEYGMVRIVAGDPDYPFGTIVKMKNLGYFGGDVYAIVLDRGGAIGKNRRAVFDILFATEENANRFGVANNIECEILRFGY